MTSVPEPKFSQLPDRLGQAHAILIGLQESEGNLITTLRFNRTPSLPLVPAHLADLDSRRPLLELHQVHKMRLPVMEFLTFEVKAADLKAGEEYAFAQWWNPDAMDSVTDVWREWELKTYPDDGSHEHCLLTWETISSYHGQRQGYESNGDWITPAAYQKFIRDDYLRLRRKRR